MKIEFEKYQGAGNDFIICDDRAEHLASALSPSVIAKLCDRRFGIGADGLMLLTPGGEDHDFRMVYYNADGRQSTMCGNGGRCIVRFARGLGINRTVYRFMAIDGEHEATIQPDGDVSLGMNPVSRIGAVGHDLELDTGSPHYLRFVPSLSEIDVVGSGRSIRRSPPYDRQGINVNFVEVTADGLEIATYERGVEDETLACGTGVTAAAVGHLYRSETSGDGPFLVQVQAKGGKLSVAGDRRGNTFTNLRLVGPATFVFHGTITI